MKRGLFSVSYAGYWGQGSLDAVDFVRKAADLGFDGVLFAAKEPHLSPIACDETRLAAVEKALEETGVECIGLAAYTDFLLPAPGEMPVLEMQELYVDRCVTLAGRLGGRVVRIFTGYDRGDASRSAQEELVTGSIRRCAERAAKSDILLSVQNHHDYAVDTSEYGMFLESIGADNVVAGYDAWSPCLRGEDLYAGARHMASKIYMTICADYLTFPRYHYEPDLVNYRRIAPDAVKATKMGAGEIDYTAFFRGLRDGGFDGWVVYEMCSPIVGGGSIENLDRYARAFLTWFDNIKTT